MEQSQVRLMTTEETLEMFQECKYYTDKYHDVMNRLTLVNVSGNEKNEVNNLINEGENLQDCLFTFCFKYLEEFFEKTKKYVKDYSNLNKDSYKKEYYKEITNIENNN